ncbi:hypothetical protein SVIOM74S_06883 [Streptomyces violarus]
MRRPELRAGGDQRLGQVLGEPDRAALGRADAQGQVGQAPGVADGGEPRHGAADADPVPGRSIGGQGQRCHGVSVVLVADQDDAVVHFRS